RVPLRRHPRIARPRPGRGSHRRLGSFPFLPPVPYLPVPPADTGHVGEQVHLCQGGRTWKSGPPECLAPIAAVSASAANLAHLRGLTLLGKNPTDKAFHLCTERQPSEDLGYGSSARTTLPVNHASSPAPIIAAAGPRVTSGQRFTKSSRSPR